MFSVGSRFLTREDNGVQMTEATNSSVAVQIFGREYKVKGHADKGYIERMAEYVDGKMRELATNSSLPSQDRLAILAALNIADELFQERTKSKEVLTAVDAKADQMISLIDESLLAGK
jgi:cell division protein ZapA